jgi:hypothetical protein
VAGTSGLFGTNVSYTIEGWFNFTIPSVTDNTNIIATNTNTYPSRWVIDANVTSSLINLRIITETNAIIYSGSTVAYSLGSWVHLAIVNDNAANTLTFYINGQAAGSRAKVSLGSYATLNLLNQYGVASAVPFYASNFRITNGQALYTGNFTPSTIPLTTTSQGATAGNVALLTFQSNRFVDNSSSPKTLTVNGSNSVVAFSPFNPTASWSAATYGGSGYFDGSGDYLTFGPTASIGTSAFTIEAWVYLTATPTSRGLWGTNTSANGGFTIRINSTTQIALDVTGGGGTNFTVPTINLNEWVHIACVRDGSNNTTVFTNGVRSSSGALTVTTNFSYLAGLGLIFPGTTNPPTGYIASARVLTGSAVYDPTQTTCTVPTAPLTAISGTQFLCDFTNAGIYDATSKNDLETLDNTVNGVRISTAQSQFGGSSIYYDGTGTDYLWIQADQPIQRFGTAPFTIELWIRLAALGSARGLVAKGTSTTGWLVSLNSSNQVVFTYGTSTITSTGTISQNVWTYIAVVREGTGSNQTKIYIGGSNDGTGTVSTDFTQTSSMYIGANRTGGDLYSGYIQDVRITNGYARTVTTIPTAAFPTL